MDPLGTGRGSLGIRGAHFGNQLMTQLNRQTFTTFCCGLLSATTVIVQLLKSDVIFTFLSTGYSTKGPLTLPSTALCVMYTALYFDIDLDIFNCNWVVTRWQ